MEKIKMLMVGEKAPFSVLEKIKKPRLVLRKKRNEYGEFKIVDKVLGEDAAYYTDDWEDAFNTLFSIAVNMAQQENRSYQMIIKGGVYYIC